MIADVESRMAGHFDAASSLFALEDWPGTVRHLKAASALDPGLVVARFNLATALARMGRQTEAIGFLLPCLHVRTADGGPQQFLGQLLLSSGRNDEAVGALVQSIAVGDPGPERLYSVAIEVGRAGCPVLAIAVLRRLVEQEPGSVRALYALGHYQEMNGQYNDAAVSYSAAARYGVEDSNSFSALGRVLERAGRIREARQAWRQARMRDGRQASRSAWWSLLRTWFTRA